MRKIADYFSTFAILVSIALLVAWLAMDMDTEYSGSVFVVDGDTIIIGKDKIRLEGIDAPELKQLCLRSGVEYRCGIKSRGHLKQLSRKGNMRCSAWQRDKYERLLGRCFVAKVDVNAKMVSDGWAVAFGNYYVEEKQARKLDAGMWVGEFERPREWRYLHKGTN